MNKCKCQLFFILLYYLNYVLLKNMYFKLYELLLLSKISWCVKG